MAKTQFDYYKGMPAGQALYRLNAVSELYRRLKATACNDVSKLRQEKIEDIAGILAAIISEKGSSALRLEEVLARCHGKKIKISPNTLKGDLNTIKMEAQKIDYSG